MYSSRVRTALGLAVMASSVADSRNGGPSKAEMVAQVERVRVTILHLLYEQLYVQYACPVHLIFQACPNGSLSYHHMVLKEEATRTVVLLVNELNPKLLQQSSCQWQEYFGHDSCCEALHGWLDG